MLYCVANDRAVVVRLNFRCLIEVKLTMPELILVPRLRAQRSRAALQRYLFYCNRYMNHMQSLRFEHKLYAQVKQKMEEMQQHNMSWIEVQFLKKAVDVLCQCRSTLMFTYVFAFYLKKNNQSIIFEV